MKAGREQNLARTIAGDLLRGIAYGVCTAKFSGTELTGRQVQQRDTGTLAIGRDGQRRQKRVLAGTRVRVECGAGCQHPCHLAAHDGLRQLRVFHLLADGDAEATPQQLLQVSFGGMVGHAAHGHGALAVARCEGQLQFA